MPTSPIIVAVYHNPIEAYVARAKLESEDIDVVLLDEGMVSLDPLLSNALGGVKVAVPRSQASRARDLLVRPNEIEAEPVLCPECDSAEIDTKRARLAWWAILFMGFPIGRSSSTNTCEACGHSWRDC